jgi:aminopeptidase N
MATVWDMLSSGDATAAEAVGAITDVLSVETVETVVDPCLELAITAAQQWAPESERVGLESQVAAAARHLVDSGVSRQTARRALVRTAASQGDLDALLEQIGDDVDLQWHVLERRAELGTVDADPVQALEHRDPDPDSWTRALRVRASSPFAAAKEEAWTEVVDRNVPIQSASKVAGALWRPGQEEVLAPYTERYLEALPTLHEGGMIPGLALTTSLFPVYAIDEAWVARAREVAAAKAAPVVVSALTERSEEVLRMVRSRGL